MAEISKQDWKLFRERIGDWQERYMERLEEGYIKLLQDDTKPASEKFWDLEATIKEDRHNPGVSLRLEKKETFYDIIHLLQLGAISMEDLDGFSENLIEEVKEYTKHFKKAIKEAEAGEMKSFSSIEALMEDLND